jgi:hypothetical protein
VLGPCQSFDDATTRARYTTKEIENDNYTIDSKKRHEKECRIKTYQACAFEEQGYTHQYLATGDKPNQEGCPGIGQGLVIHLTGKGVEVQEFT